MSRSSLQIYYAMHSVKDTSMPFKVLRASEHLSPRASTAAEPLGKPLFLLSGDVIGDVVNVRKAANAMFFQHTLLSVGIHNVISSDVSQLSARG